MVAGESVSSIGSEEGSISPWQVELKVSVRTVMVAMLTMVMIMFVLWLVCLYKLAVRRMTG
jgi:hypothetical protein